MNSCTHAGKDKQGLQPPPYPPPQIQDSPIQGTAAQNMSIFEIRRDCPGEMKIRAKLEMWWLCAGKRSGGDKHVLLVAATSIQAETFWCQTGNCIRDLKKVILFDLAMPY